ncbi:hypothetical protein [Nocardioides pelophilus]|uniref:hypothetical protein n=1 Tax=Nocardioides pelophilus TaxID=2172019 RepID=UPI001602A640|nr:hypothetical protein [Nocardioides pelophilus]
MIAHPAWRRGLAVMAATLLIGGLAACAESSDGSDESDEPSFADDTSSETPAGESFDPSPPSSTKDPTENGGFKALPDCDDLARSIVDGVDVVDTEEVEGRSCRFTIGEDPLLGRQTVWITGGGGDWPTEFKADALNDMLAEAFDTGDESYTSSVTKVRAPGWSYGVEFAERLSEGRRTSYRLFSFSENGDLLTCHTSVTDAGLGAFVEWCDDALAAVQP